MNNNTIDSVRIPREGNHINEGARAFAKNFYETVGGMGAWVLNQKDHPMPPLLHAQHEAMMSMDNMLSACVMKSEEELQGGPLDGAEPNELVLVRRQLLATAAVEAEKAQAAGQDTAKWLDEWFADNMVKFMTQLPQTQQLKMVSWWHGQPSSVKKTSQIKAQQQAYMKAHGVAMDEADSYQSMNNTEANFYANHQTRSASHETVNGGMNSSELKGMLEEAFVGAIEKTLHKSLKKAAMEVLRTADHSGSVLHAAKHQKLLNAREMWAIINELLSVMREVASNTNDMKRSLDNMEGM